mmetsp:Transcript_8662/g.29727  ORF Transcript_8662/g.29727 Transcript_8662/m.29727 type:complete len:307 (+) Transcript_8662:527-1447(+)
MLNCLGWSLGQRARAHSRGSCTEGKSCRHSKTDLRSLVQYSHRSSLPALCPSSLSFSRSKSSFSPPPPTKREATWKKYDRGGALVASRQYLMSVPRWTALEGSGWPTSPPSPPSPSTTHSSLRRPILSRKASTRSWRCEGTTASASPGLHAAPSPKSISTRLTSRGSSPSLAAAMGSFDASLPKVREDEDLHAAPPKASKHLLASASRSKATALDPGAGAGTTEALSGHRSASSSASGGGLPSPSAPVTRAMLASRASTHLSRAAKCPPFGALSSPSDSGRRGTMGSAPRSSKRLYSFRATTLYFG